MKGMLEMKKAAILTAASAAVLIIATDAFAQDSLTGVKSLNDQIDDITETVQDDLDQGNDADRYTFGVTNPGWTGSLAASASATSGNTKNRDLSLAGRLSYGAGVWAHSFGFAGEFGKTDDTKTKEKVYGTYEANRYFNDTTFAFAIASASFDEFGALAKDAFIGFGPGMRVIKQEDMTWRIQAGPGIRSSLGSTKLQAMDPTP